MDITTASCKLKFIDGARFMASSSSNIFDNLAGGIHKLNATIAIVFLNMKMSMTV